MTTSCCVCGPRHLPISSVLLYPCICPSLRPWLYGRAAGNPFLVPCGSNFQTGYVEEWEQEVHTSDDQLQERECHREDSNTWFRRAHERSEQEKFAFLTRADPWDESDSPCEPYSAPKPTNNDWFIPNGPPSTPTGLPSTPQSSWQPYSNTHTTQNSCAFGRHVLGPPDEPAALKPVVPEIFHPIQYGITPKRLLLSHSDTESLSHIDDDISSIRHGCTAWVISDATTTRERHVACKRSCSTCVPQGQREKESFSPAKIPFRHKCAKPSARADTDQHSELEPGPRRGKPGAIEEHIAGKWHIIASQEAIGAS